MGPDWDPRAVQGHAVSTICKERSVRKGKSIVLFYFDAYDVYDCSYHHRLLGHYTKFTTLSIHCRLRIGPAQLTRTGDSKVSHHVVTRERAATGQEVGF